MKYCLSILVLTVAMLAPGFSQQPAQPKPPVGIPSDARLFNGKWYRVYLERLTWTRAKEKCIALRGQLAIVPDEPTHAFIKNLSNNLNLWLGATDEKVEGLWYWLDGTEMKFKAWYTKEPGGGRRENYLLIFHDGWADAASNEALAVGYICEWKAK